MSPWAHVAAGLLGGAGQGVENVAKSRAQAEIDEAKQLRAEAFQMKVLDKQQNFQMDMEATRDAQRMGEQAVADEARRRERNTDHAREDNRHRVKDEQDAAKEIRDQAAHDALMKRDERALAAAEAKAKTDAQQRELDAFKEFNAVVNNELRALAAIETAMTRAVDEDSRLELQKKWNDQNAIVQDAREIAKNAEPSFMRAIRQELDNSDIMASTGLDIEKINIVRQGYDNNGIQEIARLINLGEAGNLSAKENKDAADAKRIFAAAKAVNPELYKKLEQLTSGATSRRTDLVGDMLGQPSNLEGSEGATTVATTANPSPATGGLLDGANEAFSDIIPEASSPIPVVDKPFSDITPEASSPAPPVEVPVAQPTAQPQEQPVAPPPVATRGTETNPTALATDELIQALPDKIKGSLKAIKDFFNNPVDMLKEYKRIEILHDRTADPYHKQRMARQMEELQGKIAAIVGR